MHFRSGAGVAQLVEQRICNPQVTGSSPIASSTHVEAVPGPGAEINRRASCAGVAERSMAADCKSAGVTPTVVQIHPPAPFPDARCGSNSGVESQPSKLLVAGSNPVSRSRQARHPVRAHVAQSVEHVLGKDGVTSSNLVVGSSRAGGRARRTQLTVTGQVCRPRIVGMSIINQAGSVTSRGPVATRP